MIHGTDLLARTYGAEPALEANSMILALEVALDPVGGS